MKIQILIPVINLWSKYTKPCLDTIKTKHEYRILLIDNNSTDETKEEASKLVTDNFIYHRNDESWSCAKSWNFGIKDGFESGCDYIVVLNNDVLLHPEAIDKLVEKFEQGWLYNLKDSIEEKNIGNIAMLTCFDVRGECKEPKDLFTIESHENTPESEHPNFSAFMINKECWDKIGEFDEKFMPCYFEDNDYHHRIQLAEMKAICVPTAMFYHFGSRTQNEALSQPICSSPAFERNRQYYKFKWGGVPGAETFPKPFNEV
jgi:GT2 family glycosyltransferase